MAPRLRGAVRRLLRGPLPVWHHAAFRLPLAGLQGQVGLDPRRADFVLTWALDRGLVRERDVRSAPEAPWRWIRLVHDEDYLERLATPEAIAHILGVDARTVPVEGVIESWRRGVGATVEATRHVLEHHGRALTLFGGFHHAAPDRGAGFCGLNDVAVAVAVARREGFRGSVAVLDLDAHPPDGLVAALRDDPRVHVASVVAESAFGALPETDEVRLPLGTGDAGYLGAVDAVLARLPRTDLAFYLAGSDPLAGDRFGGLACSVDGLRERDRRVLHRLHATPTVIVPAGGYTEGSWRVLAGTLAEAAGSAEAVATGYDPVLRRTRTIARTLDPQSLGQSDQLLTAADLHEALGIPVPEPRVLGAYTRQGLEYALHRYGILESLRRMGFSDLQVEVRTAELPHLVRVTTGLAGERPALVEVLLARRRIGTWETLFVEWLTLRDPRVPFPTDKPRLPGQEAPGLGLAEEIGHLLMRMAERLSLAGVSHVASHFHVAWMGRHRFVVVDPEERGRFRAMCRHLQAMPLAEATRRLSEEGIETEDGERIRWTPTLMVAPVDPALVRWLEAGEPRARAVEEGLSDRLVPA